MGRCTPRRKKHSIALTLLAPLGHLSAESSEKAGEVWPGLWHQQEMQLNSRESPTSLSCRKAGGALLSLPSAKTLVAQGAHQHLDDRTPSSMSKGADPSKPAEREPGTASRIKPTSPVGPGKRPAIPSLHLGKRALWVLHQPGCAVRHGHCAPAPRS